MGITVREALKLQPLTEAEVLAGHGGLDNVIQSVSVMDAPDIKDWLKGNELLITTAYVLKDDPEAIVTLIHDLHARGVAALGIKLKRFIDELPPKALSAANDLNFPLFYIPLHCSWVEIMNPILTAILHEQADLLSKSEHIHRRLTEIVLNGGQVQDVLTALSQFTQGEVAFYQDTILAEEMTDIQDKNSYKAIVQAGSRPYGWLILTEKEQPVNEIAKVAVVHGATVIALLMQREEAKKEVEQRFRNDFITDLIFGHYHERATVLKRGAFYGWDLNLGHIVCLFQSHPAISKQLAENEDKALKVKQNLAKIIAQRFQFSEPQPIIAFVGDYVLVLSTPQNKETSKAQLSRLKNTAHEIIRQAKKQMPEIQFSVGISRYIEDILEIRQGYSQAQQALRLARTAKVENTVTAYDDLGVYRLLLGREQDHEVLAFYQEKFLPLVEFDQLNRSHLVETLEAYFANNQSLTKTSQVLFIHHNTLYYRLTKIEQILDISLQDFEDRLNLLVAMKIAKIVAPKSL